MVGIWMLIARSVSIAFPVVAHAQPSAESEISCDEPDALPHALMTIPAGGRIIVRAGTCSRNFTLSRDIRIQGSGFDQVMLRRPIRLNLSSPCPVELPRLLAA